MKTLTANTTTKKNTLLGTTPINIIQIDWSTGTEYYADEALVLSDISADANILSLTGINDQSKGDSAGNIGTASVVLDDLSGDLKTKVNTLLIEGTLCTIYQHFSGNTKDDLLTLLKGRIVSEIVWSEGDRTLSFEVETYIKDDIVGYAPSEDEIENINPAAIDVPWPIGFGTPLKVPAVRVKKQTTGTLKNGINTNFTSFTIENGSEFPQDESIEIFISDILFEGTFSDSVFTVIESNKAHYTDISLFNRRLNDPNKNDANVVWLDDDAILVGLYCYVEHPTYGKMVNRCNDQVDNKCIFNKPWRPNNTTLEIILDSSNTILEAATYPKSSWETNYLQESISYTPKTFFSKAYTTIIGGSVVFAGSWYVPSGATVHLAADFDDTYVFNLLPSVEVLEVFGHREDKENAISTFSPIPSSYYTKHLNNTLGTQTCSFLTFDKPLERYIGEGWDGNVYVSYRSTKGPNGANIIKHLLTEYTNITTDTTFDAVRPLINNYWANFAVFDQPTALALVEDIAWQLRCAILIRNGVASIKYLSTTPSTDYTVTEDDVIFKSLSLGFTSTEELYTKILSKWRKDYSGQPDTEFNYIYKNNVDTFGVNELQREITIYNIKDFVTRTIDFWGYRYSNIWRKLKYQITLKGIELETFDTVATNIGEVSSNTIKGTVTAASLDTENGTMDLNVMMASRSGDSTSSEPIEDENNWTGDPDNPIVQNPGATDPTTQLEEIDYVIPTAGQTDSNTSSDTDTTTVEADEITPTYYIKVTTYPETVIRGENFTLVVETVNALGERVIQDVNALITMISTDGSDVLNKSNIFLTSGIWSSSTVQVDTGSGDDTMSLSVSATGYEGSTTNSINVIDTPTDIPVIGTSPSSVTRGTTFTFAFSGDNDATYDVALTSTDTDIIYDSSGIVTEATTDGTGAFTTSDWYIDGGNGDDTGSIIIGDIVGRAYDTSSSFSIAGLSPIVIEQTLSLTQEANTNGGTLEITSPSGIEDGVAFELTVEIQDANGNTDTGYNGTLELVFTDANGLAIDWLDLGPDASITNNQAFVNFTDGVWTYDACEVNLPGSFATPGNIRARTPYPEYTLETISDDILLGGVSFVFTSSPVGTQRGTNFTLTVEIQDANGDVVTTEAPNCTLELFNAHASDVLNKTSITSGEWVDGVWTSSTMQITGGSGSISEADIYIEDNTEAIDAAVTVVAIYSYSDSIYTTNDWNENFYGEDDTPSGSTDTWSNAQANAYQAILNDARYHQSWGEVAYTEMVASEYYWSYDIHELDTSASILMRICRFYVSDNDKNDIKTATAAGTQVQAIGYDLDWDTWTSASRVSRYQGQANVYCADTLPATFSEVENGNLLATVDCQGDYDYTWSDALDVRIPLTIFNNMVGNYLYFWSTFDNYTVSADISYDTYEEALCRRRSGHKECRISERIKIFH